MLSSSIVGVATVLCLFGSSFANPTTEATYKSILPGDGDITTSAPGESVGPCSSKPYEAEPCGLKRHQGIFSWVTDTRKYEWIYMAFCLALGSCIFIIVISAAIYNAKTYKKKQAALLLHIREEDERARLATAHAERRGSHLAQPRRSSLSVAIQDPASRR